MKISNIDLIQAITKDDLVRLVTEIGKDGKLRSISSVLVHYKVNHKHTRCRKILSDKIKEYDVPLDSIGSTRRSYDITVDTMNQVLSSSECWSDIFRGLGLSTCGHNKKHVLNFLKEHNIDEPQLDIKKTFKRGKITRTFDYIFRESSRYARSSLRHAALRFKIKHYCCEKCNNMGYWNGEQLTLELDHINGINDDNRVHNLRWLCPNCHTQTNTYKNSKYSGSVA